VERAFEDAKSECGMADYQVRKWSASHLHMALVMFLFSMNGYATRAPIHCYCVQTLKSFCLVFFPDAM
jgi:hypothetical protein